MEVRQCVPLARGFSRSYNPCIRYGQRACRCRKLLHGRPIWLSTETELTDSDSTDHFTPGIGATLNSTIFRSPLGFPIGCVASSSGRACKPQHESTVRAGAPCRGVEPNVISSLQSVALQPLRLPPTATSEGGVVPRDPPDVTLTSLTGNASSSFTLNQENAAGRHLHQRRNVPVRPIDEGSNT